MTMEHYTDLQAFCSTSVYQQWLNTWTPPREMDIWMDTESQLRELTPRNRLTARVATRLPFYLLDSLEIGQHRCVDIGCGHHWFRQFYPTMRGVDPHNAPYRDEELTPAWWIPNQGQWHRAFSINAMHFCGQAQLPDQVAKIRGLLSPGGRALVTLNRARIQERTAQYSQQELAQSLRDTPGLTRMVWMDQPQEAWLDGNVWLWLSA